MGDNGEQRTAQDHRRRGSLIALCAFALLATLLSLVPLPASALQDDDTPGSETGTDAEEDGDTSADEPDEGPDADSDGETGDGDDPEADGDLSDQGLGGRLTAGDDNEPVAGVTIVVADEAGDELTSVETDDNGDWEALGLEQGSYSITLDEDTLPDGIAITEGLSNEVERPVRREGQVASVAFPLTGDEDSSRGGRDFAGRLSQSLVNGLKFGLIIGMASIGLSLIFGTTRLINFAHGELVTLGAIVAWFINVAGIHIGPFNPFGPIPIVLAAALTALIVAAFGGALELGIFRPMRARKAGGFQLLVITIGISLALREGLIIWFGERPRNYRLPLQTAIEIGPVAITPRDLTVMAISLVILLAVGGGLQFTRVGKAVRAVADNQDLAGSSGINVKRVILLVWIVGAGLAGLGGVLFGVVTTVDNLLGFQLLLLMFAAVVLGGLGTAFGAVAGGLVVGLVTELSTLWMPSEIKYVWALVALVLVLLFRPQGIFGTRERVG